MNDAGRIGFLIRGEYVNTDTYDFLDVVYYNGDSYVAKKLTTGNQPQATSEFWQILAMGVDKELYVKKTDYATASKAGVVKPDDKTIKVESDGTIVGASSGFTGTQEEFETALEAGEIDTGTIVNITDDYQEGGITVDSELSETSENPVQNKVITGKLFNILSLLPKGAASHNAIARGINLLDRYSLEDIYAMINDGSFEDIYIKDYFDITISSTYNTSEVVRCLMGGFNTYLNNEDTPFTTNHAVIVTKNCLKTAHTMNPSDTTSGGFAGSSMWNTVLPEYNTAFGNVLGSHLLSHSTLLTKTVNNDLNSNAGAGFKGASSDWGWYNAKLSLLSEIQVYGSNVFSSSWYDTGCDNLQLPLFALDPTAKVCGRGGNGAGSETTKQWYWLRNVASASSFAYVDYSGASSYTVASNSFGVRPLFCIG